MPGRTILTLYTKFASLFKTIIRLSNRVLIFIGFNTYMASQKNIKSKVLENDSIFLSSFSATIRTTEQ